MRIRLGLRLALLLVAAGLAAVPAAPVSAGTLVWVPAGTKVGLQFLTPVDSGAIAIGAKVPFKVVAPVVGAGHVVIRTGTRVTGTVTEVTKPGAFGASSKVVIGFLSAAGADGKLIKLQDVIVSKAMVSNSRAGAAATSAAGAIVLGPVGLLAGALITGSYVKVPAGTIVTDTTSVSVNVTAP